MAKDKAQAAPARKTQQLITTHGIQPRAKETVYCDLDDLHSTGVGAAIEVYDAYGDELVRVGLARKPVPGEWVDRRKQQRD